MQVSQSAFDPGCLSTKYTAEQRISSISVALDEEMALDEEEDAQQRIILLPKYEAGGELYNTSTVCLQAFNLMQQESIKLNRDTAWLRIVHSGYGRAAWRNQLKETRLTFLHGHFPAEGDYFLVPAGRSAQVVIDMLVEVNITVRKLVWFRGMKRANKSRLLFKWAPFTVSPIGHERPTLVETSGVPTCRYETDVR
jgi:hypothetical protein